MFRTRTLASGTTAVVLGLAFAALVTPWSRAEVFVEELRVDPSAPAPVTLRLASVELAQGMADPSDEARLGLRAATIRVPIGAVVEDELAAAVVRAHEAARRPPRLDELAGLLFVFFLLGWSLSTWLRLLSPGRGALVRTQLGLYGLLLITVAIAKLVFLLTDLPTTALPIAAIPIWTRVWLDRRTAAVLALVCAVLMAALADFDPVAGMVYLVGGAAPAAIAQDVKRPLSVFPAALAGGIAGAGAWLAGRVLFVGAVDLDAELADPLRSDLFGALVGGAASGPIAYVLHDLVARSLGAVSRGRLLALGDLDQPLLVRMAKEAPGSWAHARAMANLAEAASSAIGGDALLTRIGAYYHDLGKTIQPKFFVENLVRGETTPHQGLPPDVSADAIMAHVVEGTHILRRGGIPEPVIEFAYTHHGTSVIEFFWHKCLEAGNPSGRDESFFRYPGMRPRTKETAILMLVDSIEAASRTIDPPERDRFEEMVQRIVFVKLKQGQLDESGLTLADLRTITTQLVDSLCNIYHSRIRYPWQDRKDRGDAQLPIPGAATEDEVRRARAADAAKEEIVEVATTKHGILPPEPEPHDGGEHDER